MLAIYLGPSGFGILYQFLNFQSIITNVTNLGAPVGLTTYISQEKENNELVKSAYKSLTLLISLIVITVTFMAILFSEYICNTFLGIYGYNKIFIIIILATPFLVMYSLAESYLKGFQKLNSLLKINIISSIINVIIIFPLLQFYNLEGVSIYFFIISLIPISYYIYLERSYLKYVFLNNDKFKIDSIKKILKIGVVSLVSSVMFQIALLQIRRFIILNFDINYAGLYQSLLGLSSNYIMIIFSFISYYTLPKISSLKTNLQINDELNLQLRFLLFLVIPMILMVLTFRILLLRTFYSNEFLEASNLFYFQVLGDLVRSFGALFSIWLIPKMKIKVLFIVDISSSLILILLPYLLIALMPNNLIIIAIAYFVSFLSHFIMVFLYTTYSLRFRLNYDNLKNIGISCISVILAFLINIYFPELSYYIVVLIILLNSYFILEKNEIKKMVSFVTNYLK